MKNKINVKLIHDFIKRNKLTKSRFAKDCKISPATLNKVLQGMDNVGIMAVFKIAKAIKKELHEMFAE